jgi:hypothetical protein
MNKTNYLPTKKLNTLPANHFYQIYDYKRFETKFGLATVLSLQNRFTNERFTVFLPKRYNNLIPDDDGNNVDDYKELPRTIRFLPNYQFAFMGKQYGNDYEQYEVKFRKNPQLLK